jgi:hypothetical protein
LSGPAARAIGRATIRFRIRISAYYKGKRVLYSALGDGSAAAINARTGEPIWRVPLFRAGINATVLVHNNDKLISVFGVPYEPGQLVALKIPGCHAHQRRRPGRHRTQRRGALGGGSFHLHQFADSRGRHRLRRRRKRRSLRRGCQHR